MSGDMIFRVEACLHNLFFASEDGDSELFWNVRKWLPNYIPEGSTVLRNISALQDQTVSI
jgi:hypothetical protein